MSKEKLLLICGFVIIALPHLGFPNLTEKIIFAVLGLIVMAIAYGYFFAKTKKPAKPTRTPKPKVIVEERIPETQPQVKEEVTGFTFIKRNGAPIGESDDA